MLAEIVKQDDDWLETAHDYIQWLFPLTEHSRVVPSAPTLTRTDITTFRTDSILRRHMLVALHRMLGFYGLEWSCGVVAMGPNWSDRKSNWFTEQTHNSLRITRILRSLVLVGLEAEAVGFHACLVQLRTTQPDCGVSNESFRLWQEAVIQQGRV